MTCNGTAHHCVDGSVHSPTPWRVVRSRTPYYTWLMDATGGMVCMGFGYADEHLLLAAPLLLAACEAALAGCDADSPLAVTLAEAVRCARKP